MRVPLVAIAAAIAGVTLSAQQPQTFRSRTEIVPIEVTVLDASGNPVADVQAAEFEVLVGGRRRSIQSAQFIRTEPTAVTRPAREAATSTNELPASGRLLLIVVDESNLRPGSNLNVVRAAGKLLERLSPGDAVGLTRMPDGGGVAFTHDRARIVAGLEAVTGKPPRARASRYTVYLSEADDFADTQRFQWPAALRRECGDPATPGYELCVGGVQMEARDFLLHEELKRATFTTTLLRLINALAASRMPVTIVVISEGLYVQRDLGVFSGIAAAAAAARVSLQVVRPMSSGFGPGATGFSSDPTADNELSRFGLERLAGELRGTVHEVSSTGAITFDAISRELSGYYLLGVEPAEEDQRSRARSLKVNVNRRGVTVRARSAFAMAPEPTVARDALEQLREMLKSPVPQPGLPMKVSTMVVSAPGGNARLLVSAEIGDPIDARAAYHVGFLLLDSRGEAMTSSAGTLPLEPSRAGIASPALFSTSHTVEPGEYSIRIAAIGPDGRAGSVHHTLQAALSKARAGIEVSDLLVTTPPPANRFPLFTPSAIVDGPMITALVELVHDKAAVLDATTVRFEIAGHALPAKAEPASRGAKHYRRTFTVITPLALAAGEYELRAVVTTPGEAPWTTTRAFRFEPAAK